MKKKLIVLGIVLLAGIVFFWFYFPVLSRYRELKLQEESISADITELDAKIQKLIEERQLLQNDLNYLEKVIREELGLVKPGEVVYKIVEEPPPAPPASS